MTVSYIHHHDPIQSQSWVGFLSSLASSLLSKCISTTLNAPLNFIENRYQVMGQMKKNGLIQQNYKNYRDCVMRTISEQNGIKSLWKGNLAKILMSCTGLMFSLTVGSIGKKMFNKQNNIPKTDIQSNLKYLGSIAGMFSSLASIVITYPFEYAYIRLLTDKSSLKRNREKQFKGIRNVLSETYKGDGIRGLYRGLFLGFGSIALYRISYFGLYDAWKIFIVAGKNVEIYETFLAGYFITLCASGISYPANTIRKRMMMRSLESEKYKWFGQCLSSTIKNQGFSALYRGYPIAVLSAISGSFMLMAYDNLLASINQKF